MIDSGATKSLGSVKAIEHLMRLRPDQVADVDTHTRPTFGFANSQEGTCVSTVHLNMQAGDNEGVFKVHALDVGQGPVLFSVESLRALGAVIDFREDLMMVLRSIDEKRIIRLERSSTGHQLIPLAEDWYKQSEVTQHRVPSLKEFLLESSPQE